MKNVPSILIFYVDVYASVDEKFCKLSFTSSFVGWKKVMKRGVTPITSCIYVNAFFDDKHFGHFKDAECMVPGKEYKMKCVMTTIIFSFCVHIYAIFYEPICKFDSVFPVIA